MKLTLLYFKRTPPPYRGPGGGSIFSNFFANFDSMVTKIFLLMFGIGDMFSTICVTVGSDRTDLWHLEKKIAPKSALFGYFWSNLGLIKNFSMWVTKKFSELNRVSYGDKTNLRYCLYDVCGQFDMHHQ